MIEESSSKKVDLIEVPVSWWLSFVKENTENEAELVGEDVFDDKEPNCVQRQEKLADDTKPAGYVAEMTDAVEDTSKSDETEQRRVPQVSSVADKTSESSDSSIVRVSGRAGKGRNRWLDL